MGMVKSKKQKRKWVIWMIAIIVIVAVATPILLYLHSVHFNTDYLFLHLDYVENFDDHEQEFLRIIEEVDRFTEKTPDFFETFTGSCFVTEEGLVFHKYAQYPKRTKIEAVLHPVTTEEWSWARNYSKAFPPEYNYGNIYLHKSYPDYVFFCSDKRLQFLVYTRGDGRPRELIDGCWEKFEYVHVKRVAKDWYDICLQDDKNY